MKLVFVNTINNQKIIEFIRFKSQMENTLPYRFITPLEFGIPVYHLFPSRDILRYLVPIDNEDGNTIEFDKAYFEQLMTNDYSFIDLMKILNDIEIKKYVFVLTNYEDENMIAITDSLMKAINLRYGISSYLIITEDDLIDEDNYLEDTDFESLEGHQNFIKDCERYTNLTKNITTLSDDNNYIMNSYNNIENQINYLRNTYGEDNLKDIIPIKIV